MPKTTNAILIVDKKWNITKFVWSKESDFNKMLPRFRKWEKQGKFDIIYAEKNVPITDVEAEIISKRKLQEVM